MTRSLLVTIALIGCGSSAPSGLPDAAPAPLDAAAAPPDAALTLPDAFPAPPDASPVPADAAPEAAAPEASPPDAHPPPPRTVWEFGDSITLGTTGSNANNGGYRTLAAAWFPAGTVFEGTTAVPFGPNDGHPGYTLTQLKLVATNVYPAHVAPADLVIFMGGTNDVTQTVYDGTASATAYAGILDRLRTVNPYGLILVTTIPPVGAPGVHAEAEARAVDLNARIRQTWIGVPHLIQADVHTVLAGHAEYFVGTNAHPSDTGYAAIWEEFRRALVVAGI